MRIKPKVTLISSIFLSLVVVLLTALSVWKIQQQGEERNAAYRAEAIAGVKEHLKDLVDVAYETVDRQYASLADVDYLKRYYEQRLHNILNTGETIINRYKRQVEAGTMSLQEAKNRAKAEIKELRFDGGTGYIWINDTRRPYPYMVMHPTVPSLDGKELSSTDYNNALGRKKNLFVAFVDVTTNSPDGYVDYLWPKPTPTGLTEEEPKLSYVRRYQDWDWIVGTGIYLDDAKAEIKDRIIESVKSMRYANGTGYFWINDDTLPYPTMVMHPTVPSLDGKVLDNPDYENALGSNKNLFTAFVEITAESPDKDGFVDYLWPKPTPTGLTEETDKISYVRLHEPLGWIIGSGAYIDNIDAQVAENRKKIDEQVRGLIISSALASLVFILIAIGLSYVFADSLAKPIQKLTHLATEISHGKGLDDTLEDTKRTDEIGELAKSIDRLKTSVRILMERARLRK